MTSPVPVNVYLHGKNEFYSRELRSFIPFTGKQSYEVKVQKTKKLKMGEKPCFEGEVLMINE